MSVPVFDFTTRAAPVVQIGRFQYQYSGRDRWETGLWGEARWGGPIGPAIWIDATCDVHELTTQTGRGSASDTFVPGTASIVASNVDGWGDADTPIEWSYFVDDFERDGPELSSHWASWPQMLTYRDYADELQIEQLGDVGAATVVRHEVDASMVTLDVPSPVTFVESLTGSAGTTTSSTIGPFSDLQANDMLYVSLALNSHPTSVTNVVTISGGTWTKLDTNQGQTASGAANATLRRIETWQHRVTASEAADPAQTWSVAWTQTTAYNWLAFAMRGVGLSGHYDQGFGSIYLGPRNPGESAQFSVGVSGTPISVEGSVIVRVGHCTMPHTLTPNSVDYDVDEFVVHQTHTSSVEWTWTQFLCFDGSTADDLIHYSAPAAIPRSSMLHAAPPSGPFGDQYVYDVFIVIAPGDLPGDGPAYEGWSYGRWALPYTGDHFVEATLTGLAAPERVWPNASTTIELYAHLAADDLTSQVAIVDWLPDWDDPDYAGTLYWSIDRREADGDLQPDPEFASGEVDFGPEGFPTVVVLRFEADVDGAVRLILNGTLLGEGVDPAPPSGQLVAVYAEYFAGSPSFGRVLQPGPPRFETITGGSNVPVPVTLEPGALVRIGVDHERHGLVWFFRGWVDGLTPTYDPIHADTVRIECIDALGEVGRITISDDFGSDVIEAGQRAVRLLDRADWPRELQQLDEDSTLVADSGDEARTIDLLVRLAQSCGGAVYGGPSNGAVTFRQRDWQAFDPDLAPDGYITNRPPDAVDFVGLIACPSAWERSWQRSDMTTVVELTGRDGEEQTPGEPVHVDDPSAIARWGSEEWSRSLDTVRRYDLKVLARRQLRLRGPAKFPRVEAVLFDAATSDEALDLMTVASFTKPSRYRCQLRSDDDWKFDQQYLVTGVRHTMSRSRWQTRLALDAAAPFATKGGRWGIGHWDFDVWGRIR